MKERRILLLIPNLGKGGAQRVVHDHAIALCDFHRVDEAAFDRTHDQRIYDSGLSLHDLKRNDWLSRLGPFGRLLSRAQALQRLVEREKFDVVISHLDGANWVNVLSRSHAQKILVLHGSVLFDQGQSRLRRWIRIHVLPRLIYRRAALTVAVSAGVARELKDVCGVKTVVTVNNFFDIEAIQRQSNESLSHAEASVFTGGKVLITSGRLTPGKRQFALLEIAAALKRRGVSVRLVILGDGESRSDLLQLSNDLHLKTFDVWNMSEPLSVGFDVYFLGYVSDPYKYLKRATLFLFPSAWEGFPLALCEAMICGLPVLSADCPTGPREILAPGTAKDAYDLREIEVATNGVLMPMLEQPQDLAIWVDAVQKLLSDPELRSQLTARGELAMQAFDRSAVVSQWHELIEAVCNAA